MRIATISAIACAIGAGVTLSSPPTLTTTPDLRMDRAAEHAAPETTFRVPEAPDASLGILSTTETGVSFAPPPAGAHTVLGDPTPGPRGVLVPPGVLEPDATGGASIDPEALGRAGAGLGSDAGAIIATRRGGLRGLTPGDALPGAGLSASPGIGLGDQTVVLAPSHGHTGPSGSFAVYDLGVRLLGAELNGDDDASVGIDLIGGLNAVHASVRTRRDADGFAAIPVVGTRVSWSPTRRFRVSGRATTQAVDAGSTLVDLAAYAQLSITESIGLEAGYQEIRGSFDVRGVNATLDESGVFARISIEF